MASEQSVFRFTSTSGNGDITKTVTYSLDREQWLPADAAAEFSVEVSAECTTWREIQTTDDIKRLTQLRRLTYAGYLPLIASHDSRLVNLILEAAAKLSR